MPNPATNENTVKDKVSELILRIDELRVHISDLENELKTATEHGDYIESQLFEANKQLKGEIHERISKEISFKKILDSQEIQKNNLEIMLETVTEHSDQLDKQLLERISDAEHRADTDALTQLANRGHFDMFLTQEWNRSLRDGTPIAIIMIDIDFFKPYNDKYGHPAGDVCIKKVANAIQFVTPRATDLAARYGGEEFCIILPNTILEYALLVSHRLHTKLAELNILHEYATISNRVSLSMGAFSCVPHRDKTSLDLVVKVDQLLYKAKQKGRDRTVSEKCEIF